jgi:hypothetical protein
MLNRTPKPLVQTFDQVSSLPFSLNTRSFIIHRSSSSWSTEALYFSLQRAAIKFTDYSITTRSDTTVTSQHRPEVEATIANSRILLHSHWLASSNRCKLIRMPYFRIFATVCFNLTTAKISKYSALIGLLRLDEPSQSEWGNCYGLQWRASSSEWCDIVLL